jgi:head-tail adaptor
MRSGSLYFRVDILKPTEVTDVVGGATMTWEPPFMTIRAAREDIGGKEIFRGAGLAAQYDRKYTIRDPETDIDATMRLRDPAGPDGEVFEIRRFARLPGLQQGIEIFVTAVDRTGRIAA